MSTTRLAGALTGPCVSANIGVGDVLEGQLFAYGVGSSITVVDLTAFEILCTLQGGHGKIPVTAVAWHPDCHGRDLRTAPHLKSVPEFDVGRGMAVQDSKFPFENSEGVKCLAWVMHHPTLLAVVLGPSTLVLCDVTRGGTVLWHKDLAGVGSLHSLSVDPLDRHSVCLCGSNGVCLLIGFAGDFFNKTTVKQYRVSSTGTTSKMPSNLHCLFPHLQNTLLVMLSTEILIFDVEFGQPLGSIPLPKGYKPFKKLIGVYGHSTSYGTGLCGGTDCIFTLHEDDTLTAWNRVSDALRFSLGMTSKMVPRQLRGMHGSQLHIMTSSGCIWRNSSSGLADRDDSTEVVKDSDGEEFPGKSLLIVNVMSNGQLWRWHTPLPHVTTEKPVPTTKNLISFNDWSGSRSVALLEQLEETPTVNGTPKAELQSIEPRTPKVTNPGGKPVLERVLSTPAGSVTHVSVLPLCLVDENVLHKLEEPIDSTQAPSEFDIVSVEVPEKTPRISLPEEPFRRAAPAERGTVRTRTPILAVVTATGSLEIVGLRRGCLTTVHPKVLRSFSIHEFRCRTVRWLGKGPLVVSFTSEKADRLWHNVITLTDVRTGETAPFRVTRPESTGMLGVRASPAGRYVVVLLKDAPSEIWLVTDMHHVKRVRHLEIPFTAVDWAHEEQKSEISVLNRDWSPQHCHTIHKILLCRAEEGAKPEEFPLETLVFTVSDGRVGSISLQGKKVINSKVRLPGWANFGPSNSLGRCISIAAVGPQVLLGDYDGNLIRWDLDSGKSETLFADAGPVRRILINPYLRGNQPSFRVAILSATWKCNVYDLDDRGKLFRSTLHHGFRLMDVSWVPGLHPSGISTLLTGITEEGNVILVEVELPEIVKVRIRQNRSRDGREKKETDVGEESLEAMSGHAAVATALWFPKTLTLFIRLLLQSGLPLALLDAVLNPDSTEDAIEVEKRIWECLPVNLQKLGTGGSFGGTGASLHSPTKGTGAESRSPTGDRETVLMDAKKRARRRISLMDISGRMSLASEVLKSIEEENMRAKGILSRVRGHFSRSPDNDRSNAPVHASVASADPSRQWSATESLSDLLNIVALLRCEGRLLLPTERAAYAVALEAKSIAARMAVAAFVSGDSDEVEFWRHLPATLANFLDRAFPDPTSAPPRGACLWDQPSTVTMAQARAKLHDRIPRAHIESHPELQEKRLLEYVSLGDYHTAVGFLLSSAPEASVRYYRDSLCAYALASVGTADGVVSPAVSPIHAQERNSLHLQVAKVVSAHAASVGDSLLGVPLLCAAGLHHEAVNLLQDAALWSYAAVLTASTMEGPRHAISCLRWAQHVWRDEGSLWRAVGILTAGGCLKEAAQVLVDEGYTDCAAAYCEACAEFDLTHSASDGHVQLYSALPSNQLVRVSSVKPTLSSSRSDEDLSRYSPSSILGAYNEYVTAILTGM